MTGKPSIAVPDEFERDRAIGKDGPGEAFERFQEGDQVGNVGRGQAESTIPPGGRIRRAHRRGIQGFPAPPVAESSHNQATPRRPETSEPKIIPALAVFR